MWWKKEIETRLDSFDRTLKIMEKYLDTLRIAIPQEVIVPCDKCKHLIYRKDAIKGESRIEKHPVFSIWEKELTPVRISDLISTEIIVEVFYCPNCVPKKTTNTWENHTWTETPCGASPEGTKVKGSTIPYNLTPKKGKNV